MKIAIPNNNGEVNQHFGQSTSFAVIEIGNNNQIVNIDEVSSTALRHAHEGLAELLKGQGVDVVIVGGIGKGALDALEAQGLKVLFGASGPVKEVAGTFARGEFVSQRRVCHHHGGHHHHHNHNGCSHS